MRNRIGFFYINDPNWTGGQDYVVNAVNSLNFLEKVKQPKIDIFVDESVDLTKLKSQITYTKYQIYIFSSRNNLAFKVFRYLLQRLRWKFIYPFPKGAIYEKIFKGVPLNRRIFWIPDFQEEYFTNLFDDESLKKRRKMRGWLASQNRSTVVFSSNNAQKDFFKFYGSNLQAKTKVLHFANPNQYYISKKQKIDILLKYGLETDSYFICPNQFWKHKNHSLVIDGVRRIHEMGHSICVVFCGKEQDPRDLDYFPMLRKSAEDLVQLGVIKFLGFLPKDDQMCLISESKALIQPSSFEGWSTTIEDAVALNKQVLAADLEVNIEQLGSKGVFFEQDNVSSFVEKLKLLNEQSVQFIDYYQNDRIIKFANAIIELNS
jgi:glycosyltransferase involved in cell wall biosynthesis